jgi:hypothetical protein
MRKGHSFAPFIVGLLGLFAVLSFPALSPGQPAAPATPQSDPEVSAINPERSDCNNLKPSESRTDETTPRKDRPITADILTSGLPCAPNFVSPFSLDNLQHGFDFYSWLTFIALNSPADGKNIVEGASPRKDARTKWEDVKNFRQLADIMRDKGQKPEAWGTPAEPPAACPKDAGQDMVIHLEEETFNQPFKTGPLIDQNGNYALFDILMNQVMFDYIVENGLYTKEGQLDFKQRDGRFSGSPDVLSPHAPGVVNFPKGKVINDRRGAMGAIMLKVSWKIMDPVGDKGLKDFHTINALVHTPEKIKDGVKIADATCVMKKLGLIGFHVGHKTTGAPQWIWSTFEHVNNVPEQADVNAGKALGPYSLFNARCKPKDCPVNQTPPFPWEPGKELKFHDAKFKSQITRAIPLTRDVRELNKSFQALLKGTVWANYQLIITQWPSDATNKIDRTGVPAPTYLANTTLETYSQGSIPLASSSCMACHNNATTHAGSPSDFTFTLEKARSSAEK